MPSAFNLDLIRASLGPDLITPYEAAFGAVPWLTTGTLSWPAAHAEPVLAAWLRWAPERTLTAVRLGEAELAVDVAVLGDPWGAPRRLQALRDHAPTHDTVALAGPHMLRAPNPIAAAEVALRAVPSADALTGAAAAAPDGVCVGLRRTADGASLFALGARAELPRSLAVADQLARGLDRRAIRERPGSDRRAMGATRPR
jgi:hypothetical protein